MDAENLSSVGQYRVTSKIGEGTFGQVYLGTGPDGLQVALKRLVFPYEQQQDPIIRRKQEQDGIPLITYRELRILKLLNHPNIVRLIDVCFLQDPGKPRPKLFFVFPFMHHDLAGLLDNSQVAFTPAIVKCYLKQILEGVRFMHFNNIIHRDLKPANLLINNDGVLMITDFGLARPLDEQRKGDYTPNVVTRWYRAPELCLGSNDYSTKIDVWSVGCIFGELLLRRPILQGTSDVDQIFKIIDLCGTPHQSEWPGWPDLPNLKDMTVPNREPTFHVLFSGRTESCIALLKGLLQMNPQSRLSADLALDSDYMWEHPLPALTSQLPEYPSSHEYTSKTAQERRMYARQV